MSPCHKKTPADTETKTSPNATTTTLVLCFGPVAVDDAMHSVIFYQQTWQVAADNGNEKLRI